MVGLSPRARRSGQRAGRPADRKDQLGQHLVDIGRMILRLGPIEGLGTRAPLRRHAEIHVADDAGAVERAEEVGGDLVLQFLLADGRWITRCHAHIIPKPAAAVQAAHHPRAVAAPTTVRGWHPHESDHRHDPRPIELRSNIPRHQGLTQSSRM